MKLLAVINSLIILSSSIYAQNTKNCQQEVNALKVYHTELMQYKSSTNKTPYLDLVRLKNSINAELTLNNALDKITKEYYNYLGKSSHPDIKKLNNLQLFLQKNAPAAHKMALATEMIGVLSDPELTGNRTERFQQVKSRLQNSCSRNPNANYCKGLGKNFWQSLSDKGTSMPEGTHSSMIEHFIHITAASRDVGRHFIKNKKFNTIIQNDPNKNLRFTKVLSKALDEVAKNCANRDLLGGKITKGGSDSCLNVKLKELRSDPNNILASTLSATSNDLNTLGDVVSNYFQLMDTAKNSQLKLTGKMINEFSNYTSANMVKADQAVTIDSRKRNKEFNKLKENLAGTIHGAFKLAASHDNLAALLEGMSDKNLNPLAKEQLDTINTATKNIIGYDNNLFRIDGDHIKFNRAKLGELLVKDKINTIDLRNKRNALVKRLAAVNAELETFKDQKGFIQLESLKNFTWDNLRYHCSNDRMVDRDNAGDKPCSYKAGYNQGLDSLMSAASSISEANENVEELKQIKSMLAFCDNSENLPTQRETLNRTCSTAISRKAELQRQQGVEARRKAARKKLVSEDDFRYVYKRRKGDKKGYERTGETKPRRRWVKEGLTAGVRSAIGTILPVGIGYFQTRGSLLQTSVQAKQNISFNAWRSAQATYPQNNCHIYVCSFNSSVFGNTGLGVARNYTGYAGFGTGTYGQTTTMPSVDFSMPAARPTSP